MPQQDEDDNALSSADRELESALKSLAPSAALGIDPIAAAFVAGQRAKRREIFAWRCATTAALFVAVAFWAMLPLHNTSVPESRAGVSVAYRAPTERPTLAPQQSVLILNEVVRERGIEGLPAAQAPAMQLNANDLF